MQIVMPVAGWTAMDAGQSSSSLQLCESYPPKGVANCIMDIFTGGITLAVLCRHLIMQTWMWSAVAVDKDDDTCPAGDWTTQVMCSVPEGLTRKLCIKITSLTSCVKTLNQYCNGGECLYIFTTDAHRSCCQVIQSVPFLEIGLILQLYVLGHPVYICKLCTHIIQELHKPCTHT